MEYCLGNGLELFSASNVFAVCHDSSVIRDFKIRDATASRTRWLINGLGLERRRLRGKSKVNIPVWMQDNAAAKRSLSV